MMDLDNFEAGPGLRGKIRWMLEVWRPMRLWLFVLLFLTAVSVVVALSYPLILRYLLDLLNQHLESKDPGPAAAQVRNIVLFLLALGVGRVIAHLYPATRAYLNVKIDRQVRETYFAFLLRKGYRFFLRFRTGDLVTRLTDEISEYPRIAWFCCSGIFRAVDSGSKFLFCLVVMLTLDWRLALLGIAPLPFMILLFLGVHQALGRRAAAHRAAVSETNELLEASFSGIRIVKAFNAELRQGDALRRQLEHRIGLEMSLVRMQHLIHLLHMAFNLSGQIVVVCYGGLLVTRGELSPGTFYAFYAYLGMLAAPLLDVPNVLVAGRQAFVSMDRVEELRLWGREEEGGAFRGTHGVSPFQSLQLQAVGFSYPQSSFTATGKPSPAEADSAVSGVASVSAPVVPGATATSASGPIQVPASALPGAVDPGAPAANLLSVASPAPALQDIHLTLRRGERVAIVGPLGSGKSTLLRMASGTMVPSTGQVLINGLPLEQLDALRFGQSVGLVPQEPVLLGGTVRDNLLFGRAEDPARLQAVLEAVGISAEIAALPKGLDEPLSQRGTNLSGGQRQRLTMARALYGQPELLLLDDLTSALDAENEDRLWRHLEHLAPQVAILCVTHRIATARAMDRIVLLEDGRITASGTHEQLLQSSPLYREFQQEAVPA